jgi:hypothetical protein
LVQTSKGDPNLFLFLFAAHLVTQNGTHSRRGYSCRLWLICRTEVFSAIHFIYVCGASLQGGARNVKLWCIFGKKLQWKMILNPAVGLGEQMILAVVTVVTAVAVVALAVAVTGSVAAALAVSVPAAADSAAAVNVQAADALAAVSAQVSVPAVAGALARHQETPRLHG